MVGTLAESPATDLMTDWPSERLASIERTFPGKGPVYIGACSCSCSCQCSCSQCSCSTDADDVTNSGLGYAGGSGSTSGSSSGDQSSGRQFSSPEGITRASFDWN